MNPGIILGLIPCTHYFALFFRFGIVFPWFVYYFKDVPSLSSTSFLGLRMSSKFITYLLGFQVIVGSIPNTIMAISALVNSKFKIFLLNFKKFYILGCWLSSSNKFPVGSEFFDGSKILGQIITNVRKN